MSASASPTYARVERTLGALTVWHGSLVTGVAVWGFWLLSRASDTPDRGETALNFGLLIFIGLFVSGSGVLALLGKFHAWGWGIVPSVWAITAAFLVPIPWPFCALLGLTGATGVALFLGRMHRVGLDARARPTERP